MSYEMIDRFLRNNLDDDDYAKYSLALDQVASPPQRTWQGLTDVERAQIVLLNKKLTWLEQLDVFEAKLKEKNI